jgi:ubiquinone/menaquinone biosynthesis C-methylase UbiE
VFRIVRAFLRTAYKLLYHPFAWSYDLVSGIVSLGQWDSWVMQVVPLVRGSKILELGFGPGHLQLELSQRGFLTFGLDESKQMVKQASYKLKRNNAAPNLVRGLSQNLPFESAFNTVVATFPSEYVFEPETIKEITRALVPGGRLVVLLGVSPGNANSRSKLLKYVSSFMGVTRNEYFKHVLEQTCNLYEMEGIKTDIIRIPCNLVTLVGFIGEKLF